MSDLERYLEEIAYLRNLPEDANVRDAIMTRESGPETPEERLGTIESIFGEEGWDFPADYSASPTPTFSRMFHRMSGL
jgi:hypothetical protein